MAQTTTLSLYRFPTFSGRLWAFTMMGLARGRLSRTPGLQFYKLCGSGTGEGFTPFPNTAVWAILAVWDSAEAADWGTRTQSHAQFEDRAEEAFHIFLQPISARGEWSGTAPFAVEAEDTGRNGPLAVLTRASVRGAALNKFWMRVPSISETIGSDPNVMFKIGIGEMPWKHQVTFSIWPDAPSVAAFARHGPHQEAIRAVRDHDWFSEELYARFTVTDTRGTWSDLAQPLLKVPA
ncbi:MAG: spheroidene monooxygenase [Shimia sp.]